MKKMIAILSIVTLGLGSGVTGVSILPTAVVQAQEQQIAVTIDGASVQFPDQQPVLVDNRVLVPVRGVFEAMDAEVGYEESEAEARVRIDYEDMTIMFVIGQKDVTVSKGDTAERKYLDVSTQLIRERAMIPIRFVSETIGYDVHWNQAQNRVEITAPAEAEKPEPGIKERIQTKDRVSLGAKAGLAIKDDGTVWGWGEPKYGQLGGVEASETPVQIPGLANIVAVACGNRSMYALKSDGTVWSWGYNAAGELGRQTGEKQDPRPGQIPELTGISSLSAGGNFALALDEKGRVWSWGNNHSGQLGFGDAENRTSPTQIEAISKRVISISAGNGHGAAVSQDQLVWLWGTNSEGQLGKSKGTLRITTPFQLKTINRLTEVSAGGGQTAALRTDGSVYMWGTTYVGQPPEGTKEEENLGDAEGFHRYDEPQRMRYVYHDLEDEEDKAQILVDASMISSGDNHTAALVDGKIYVWGDSALMAYRMKDQVWRYHAQAYIGLDQVQAVYAAKERDIYALDQRGVLWRIGSDGRKEVFDTSV